MHSVAAGAGHYVNMQMRDALVDRVVDPDKTAFGAEGGASRGEALRGGKWRGLPLTRFPAVRS